MEFTEIIENRYKTIYFIYGRITKHQIGASCIIKSVDVEN